MNLITYEAHRAIQIGRKNHWRFRVVTESSYKDGWVYETTQDIPDKAKARLNALQRANVPFKEMVIAHEAPKLLNGPTKESIPQVNLDWITTIVSLFLQFLILDPALIVVLEDGTWLEVMTWYE